MSTGFIAQKKSTKTPIAKGDFRHAMCLGKTGCGKTTSFILPNIKDRMKKNHGMFILDYKGTLHLQVKAVAKQMKVMDKVVEVGSPWGNKIDLLRDVSKDLLLESLDIINGQGHDRFWANSGLNLIGDIYDTLVIYDEAFNLCRLCKIDEKVELNFKYLWKILSSKDNFFHFIEKIEHLLDAIADLFSESSKVAVMGESNSIRLYSLHKDLLKQHKVLKDVYDTMEDGSPSSGSYGVFFQAKNTISGLKEDFLSGDDDILDLLNNGKIIILNTSELPPSSIAIISNILYKRVTKRYNTKTGISFIIDEFQRSVTKDSLPHIDVFREKRVELIAAMQNVQLLESKVGLSESEGFMQNIIELFEYDEKNVFEYKKDNKSHKAKPIYFTQDELELAQYEWQLKTLSEDFQLQSDYIYLYPINNYRYKMKNIATQSIEDGHFKASQTLKDEYHEKKDKIAKEELDMKMFESIFAVDDNSEEKPKKE